jgi:heme exporter protein A
MANREPHSVIAEPAPGAAPEASWRYEISNIRCERDERLLFRGLSFDVGPGDIVQIEGPNGAGKTTLLRILSGLSQQFEGELRWCGEPMARARLAFRNDLLYLGHAPGVKALLTPQENLRWSVNGATPGRAAIMSALQQVGLYGYEDVPCFSLSAGQQRRVALARLYLAPARLWILDEPFTAIDRSGVAALEQHIAAHASCGGGVILTTHHVLQLPGRIRRINLAEHARD